MDKIVVSLLKISSDELMSARTEYKMGIYHKSLFLFQQSIEKAYKALAIDTRQINVSDLRNVGHDYVKLLKTSLNSLPANVKNQVVDDSKELFDDDEQLSGEEIFAEVNKLARTDFFNLSEDDIKYYLTYLNKCKRVASKSNFANLTQLAIDSNKLTDSERLEAVTEQMNGYSEEQIKLMIMFQCSGLTLQILALFTSPHSEQTRYPLEHNDYKCPTEIYTKDFPLIKHQKKLMKMAQEAIDFLKLHCPVSQN